MCSKNTFCLFGDILYSQNCQELAVHPGSYLVCEEGLVAGIYDTLPEKYAHLPLKNHAGKLILPGLVDLHLHAPQFAFMGLSMDLELLEWLEQVTFPEEAKYSDIAYANTAYRQFTGAMQAGPTTRACTFATLHNPATLLLMDLLEESGLICHVGKVNMNRNCPDTLREESTEASLQATEEWLESCRGRYQRTRPIITPRFIPNCTDDLLRGLSLLREKYRLPIQSHLCENPGEVAWVRELCPEAANYADAYDRFGLLGTADCPAIMAHCVWPEDAEIELMQQRNVYVAHCPNSNANLSSGIAPVRQYLRAGLCVGLGTDVAGGATPSLFRVMADAIQHSKLRWRLVENADAPLTLPEAFHMATRGGGSFFGKVGAFEPGYAFDVIVLDDSPLVCPFPLSLTQRLERMVYLSGNEHIREKYAAGQQVK